MKVELGLPHREDVQSITEITSHENMTGSSEEDDGDDGGVNDDDDDIVDAKDDDEINVLRGPP